MESFKFLKKNNFIKKIEHNLEILVNLEESGIFIYLFFKQSKDKQMLTFICLKLMHY